MDDELFSHIESALPTQAAGEPAPLPVFLAADDAAPVEGSATVTPVSSKPARSGPSREQRRFERRAEARRVDRTAVDRTAVDRTA